MAEKTQRDYGLIKTADSRNVFYLQSLSVTDRGHLASAGLIDLENDELEAFFATKPAKVDVGINANTNPYKMGFFTIDPQQFTKPEVTSSEDLAEV